MIPTTLATIRMTQAEAIPVGGDTGGGDTGDGGPFVGGGQTYTVGQTTVVTGFDPTRDVLDLGPNSIHNQIPIDTPDGFMSVPCMGTGLEVKVLYGASW